MRPLATSCTKDYKAHSPQQTSFAELPNSSGTQFALSPVVTRVAPVNWLEVWNFLQVIWHTLSLFWYDCTLNRSKCFVSEITGKQEVFLDSDLHSGLHLLSAGLKASRPESKALKLKILAYVK